MIRAFHTSWRVALATAVFALAVGAAAPAAHAVGPHTWWVAPSGNAASPADTGTSCANPSYSGNTAATIQDAITGATAGDEIKICEGTYSIGATLVVDKALTLTGVGSQLPVLDGGGATRIMDVTTGGFTVTIDRLHFRNGRAAGSGESGAGIRVHPNATVMVGESFFSANVADEHGGGIGLIGSPSSTGSVQVTNSTFYNNRGIDGGGIAVVGNTINASNVSNSTFVRNSASRNGGALGGSFAHLDATQSTFIDNLAPQGGDNSWVVSIDASLIAYTPSVTPSNDVCNLNGSTPVNNVSTSASCLANGETPVTSSSLALGFLAPWGGPVPTFSIGAGSSAIDAVAGANCSATDQRGVSRAGGTCDAGAFEFVAGAPSLAASSSITIIQARAINSSPTFTKTGLTEPVVLRVASEIAGALPGGLTFSSSSGSISGTPTSTWTSPDLIVSATDANGAVASARVNVDNCVLTQSNGDYVISNAIELELFRLGVCGLGADYVQTADIAWNSVWSGPASSGAPFTGSYDGGGYSIIGLQISGGETAFLSHTNGAVIENLEFSVAATGAYATAGLIRSAVNTTIDSVHGSGTVTISGAEGCHGGLVGEADNSTISDSSFEGTIDAPGSSWNGGLVGCPWGSTVIERSSFDGSVTGWDDIGGLVGWMSEVDIRDSYAIGSVEGSNDGIGGLVGWLEDDSSDIDTVAVSGSYASMTIDGTATIGALIGEGESTSVSNSFWEAGLTGVAGLDPIGLLTGGGNQPTLSAASASQLTSFAFFDTAGWAIVDGWSDPATSQDVWGICDGEGRPFLLSHHSTDPCVVAQQPSPQPNNPPAPAPAPATPPATSTPPTTSTPVTNPTAPITPSIPVGGMVTMVGGREVPSSVAWSGGSTLTGRIGDVDLSIAFPTTSMNSPASLAPGSSLNLTIGGLAPGSSASATIFSTPTSLGEFTVGANGRLSTGVSIPRGLAAGTHRLRLAMTAANGDEITFWVGVTVPPSALQLPTTGSSDGNTAVLAGWLLVIGIGLTVSARRRPTLRGSIQPTD